MRIERVEAIAIRIPLTKTYAGSKYNVDSRCTVITRIHAAGGLVSEVYNGDNREHGPQLVKIITDEIAPLIVGEPIYAWERIWQKMFAISYPIRDRQLAMQAIACVDTAVWDIFAKSLGVSVCKLLGGYRERLPIIAIAGYYAPGKTEADVGREMEWLRSAGMAGCKLKVGGLAPEADALRVKAAREGGGIDFILAVDANRGWSVADAIRFSRLVEPYDVSWFEEPCYWFDDARSMAEVRRATSIPINAGQSEICAAGVRRLLDADAVDFVNFDASEGGGVSEWRRAAAACALQGILMAHHEEPQIAAHLLGAVPHGTCVECFPDPERDPLWAHMYINRPPIADGIMTIPDEPGFGIHLDWQMVEKYKLG
jgi:D-galactarolactone cycloisomerase